ncbi:MAG: AMP-binding protein [Magnetococcus sp. WYHC-3]
MTPVLWHPELSLHTPLGPRDARELHMLAQAWAAELTRRGARRLRLQRPDATQTLVALAAAQQSGVDVLLTRAHSPAVAAAWPADMTADGLALIPLTEPAPHTPCPGAGRILLQTSGTSGPPKTAGHTLERLLGRLPPRRDDTAAERWLLCYPAASFAGLQVVLSAARRGAMLAEAEEITVTALAALARTLRPTHISATPTCWRGLLAAGVSPAQPSGAALGHITLGGETVDQGLLDALTRAFPGASLHQIYASTEAGALFTVKDRQAGFPALWLTQGIDGVRMQLDPAGQLLVHSPRCHVDHEDAAGWLATGDMVEQRGERCYFLGRGDAVVNVGGVKVHPEAVEAVLRQCPGVADVCVRGHPNPITGQVVVADVVAQPGSDTVGLESILRTHAAANLERPRRPAYYHWVAALPTGATGKTLRSSDSPSQPQVLS